MKTYTVENVVKEPDTTVWFVDRRVDLYGLPEGSVISDIDGYVWQKDDEGWWKSATYVDPMEDIELLEMHAKWGVSILRIGYYND